MDEKNDGRACGGTLSTRTTLVPLPCFPSSFWLLRKCSQVLLHLSQLLPSFPLVICAKGTQGLSVCQGPSRATQALTSLPAQAGAPFPPSARQGTPEVPGTSCTPAAGMTCLFLLKKWICLCYATGNRMLYKELEGKKPKISYFNWLLLKRFCIPSQDPPEHKKHNSRVCLKSKPRLNLSRSQSQTRSRNQNQMCCSIPRKSSFQIKM